MLKPSGRRPRGRSHIRPGRVTRGALAVLTAACLAVSLSGCGNWISVTYAGQVGLTVDAAGQPVAAIFTCSKARPIINMSEGLKASDNGKKPNVDRGTWTARRGFAGVQKLALAAPGENWTPRRGSGPLQPGTLFIIGGGTVEVKDATLGAVDFHTKDLARLSPDKVLVDGKIESWSAFRSYKCP